MGEIVFLLRKEGWDKKGGRLSRNAAPWQTLTQSCLPRSHLVTKLEQMTTLRDLCPARWFTYNFQVFAHSRRQCRLPVKWDPKFYNYNHFCWFLVPCWPVTLHSLMQNNNEWHKRERRHRWNKLSWRYFIPIKEIWRKNRDLLFLSIPPPSSDV